MFICEETIRKDWADTKEKGFGQGKQSDLNMRVAEFCMNGNQFEGGFYEEFCTICVCVCVCVHLMFSIRCVYNLMYVLIMCDLYIVYFLCLLIVI